MRIEILNPQGAVVNTIVADEAFAKEHYPSAWQLAAVQDVPPAPVTPHEVPRWAGVLALKRHALTDGELAALGPDDANTASLLAQVLTWRETLPDGEQADRVDAALNDVKDWRRDSEILISISRLLGVAPAQIDVLFAWAAEQRS